MGIHHVCYLRNAERLSLGGLVSPFQTCARAYRSRLRDAIKHRSKTEDGTRCPQRVGNLMRLGRLTSGLGRVAACNFNLYCAFGDYSAIVFGEADPPRCDCPTLSFGRAAE